MEASLNEEFKEALEKDSEPSGTCDPEVKDNSEEGSMETSIGPSDEEIAATAEEAAIEAEDISAPASSNPEMYLSNNSGFELQVPKLCSLTKIINRAGYNVLYNWDPLYKNQLIEAVILKGDTTVRTIGVDPYVLYGDNLRVITRMYEFNRNDESLLMHDIRKELFIPISKANIITKYIKNGVVSDKDKEILINALPNPLKEIKKGKYFFLDRMDMRYIVSRGRKGMSFDAWHQLVTNVNSVLRDTKNVPLGRYRFDSTKPITPNEFTLVADAHAFSTIPFNSSILADATAAATAAKGVVVTYKDKEYSVSFLS